MKFLKALKEQKFRDVNGETIDFNNLNLNSKMRYRMFEAIPIIDKKLWLSIQASCAHYATPRETFDNLKKYTHWEFALVRLEEGEEESDFVRVSDILPDFPSLAEIEYYEQDVYAYVPSDLVEELYLAVLEYKNQLH